MKLTDKAPSAPDRFRRHTATIELPDAQDGEVLVVTVQAVVSAESMVALQGLPGFEPDPDPNAEPEAPEQRRIRTMDKVHAMRALAAQGLVAPPFSFEEREEGKAFWGDLTWGNQLEIGSAIAELSGIGPAPAGGPAEKAGKFPEDGAGADDGGPAAGGDEPAEPGAAAAPEGVDQ